MLPLGEKVTMLTSYVRPNRVFMASRCRKKGPSSLRSPPLPTWPTKIEIRQHVALPPSSFPIMQCTCLYELPSTQRCPADDPTSPGKGGWWTRQEADVV